jgi:hypothetical protein
MVLVLTFVAGRANASEALGLGDMGIGAHAATVDARAQGDEASPIQISVLVGAYYSINFQQAAPTSSGNPFVPPGIPTYNMSRYNLTANQLVLDTIQLTFEKEAANPKEAGFEVQLTMGQRAGQWSDRFMPPMPIMLMGPFQQSGGWDPHIDVAYISYSVGLGQLSEKAKLLLKLGRIESMLGIESINAEENPNLSLSSMRSTMLPFVNMGLQAELYLLNEQLVITTTICQGTVGLGYDNPGMSGNIFFDNNSAMGMEGTISYTHKFAGHEAWIRGKVGLNWGMHLPQNQADGVTVLDVILEGGLTLPGGANRKLSVGIEFVVGRLDPGAMMGEDYWGMMGIIQVENVMPWLDMALRVEYFDDKDGLLTFSLPYIMTMAPNAFSIVLTADFKINDNLTVRSEFRHAASNVNMYVDDDQSMIVTGSSDTQDTFTLAAIVEF